MRRFGMFANQLRCQCDCFFNVRIDGRFIPNCSQLSGQKTAHARMGKPSLELNIRLFNSKHNAIYFANFLAIPAFPNPWPTCLMLLWIDWLQRIRNHNCFGWLHGCWNRDEPRCRCNYLIQRFGNSRTVRRRSLI